MWNSGLCGLKSFDSFCGDEIFAPCELLERENMSVGRFCVSCFFDGIVFNDGGIGFSNRSCLIQLSELNKWWFSRLWDEATLLLLLDWRNSLLDFCGECGSFGDASDNDSKLFKFFGNDVKPRT